MTPGPETTADLPVVIRSLREHHWHHSGREHADVVNLDCPWCLLWEAWRDQDVDEIDAVIEEFGDHAIALEVASRDAVDDGRRLTLDELLDELGYTREQLAVELNVESRSPRAAYLRLQDALRRPLATAIQQWALRRYWWIQSAAAFVLLAFAAYLLWIDEPLSAAMLAALVVVVMLRSRRSTCGHDLALGLRRR